MSEISNSPTVTPEDIATFQQDGVVALRGKFSKDWINLLRQGISSDLGQPGVNLVNHCKEAGAPAYWEDFWCWSEFAEFERFVRGSPVAGLAARLLNAGRVNLVMDNWFVREAGSTSRAPFHHDISYFDFTGLMCVLWLPLEPVSRLNGISFVRGSHLWNKLFMRVRFDDGHWIDGAGTEVNGVRHDLPPDVATQPENYDLVDFDLDLGDCIFFDMRTLHGSLATSVPTETVQRYTLRMTAEDGRIAYRGDWGPRKSAPCSRRADMVTAMPLRATSSRSCGRAW